MSRVFFFVSWLWLCVGNLPLLGAGEPELEAGGIWQGLVENKGQWPQEAKFFFRKAGMDVWLTDRGLIIHQYRISQSSDQQDSSFGHVVRLSFATLDKPRWFAVDQFRGVHHFILSTGTWTNVHKYRKVIADYGACRLEYLFDQDHGTLRYNIVVLDPSQVTQLQLQCEGADSLWIDSRGQLVIETSVGQILQSPPVAFLLSTGEKLPCDFRVQNHTAGVYSFTLQFQYPYVIDPLVFSTLIGGVNGDEVWGVAVGKNNEVYITGRTFSITFPTTVGAYQTNKNLQYDAFVVKFNSSVSALEYATFLGGSGDDYGVDIAVDQSGYAYITGVTWSSDFPLQSPFNANFGGQRDVFVSKLSSDGSSLVYSTFVGGLSWDDPSAIVVTSSGEAVVCGQTVSSNFPVTPNAISLTLNGEPGINTWDGFVFKLNGAGNQLLYSTFIGGRSLDESRSVAVDGSGNIYVTGRTISANFHRTAAAYDTTLNDGDSTAFDAYVLKIHGSTGALLWSSFLGGSGDDEGNGVAVLSNGNVVVVGGTSSNDFPASNTYAGGGDAFCAILSSSGNALIAAKYFGGSSQDLALDVAVDNTGLYITGNTHSGNFPTTSNAYDQSANGNRDVFGVKWNTNVSQLLYSSYLGGSANEEGLTISVDDAGGMVIAGYTLSANFPVTRGVYDSTFSGSQGDGYVVKLGTLPPAITVLTPDGGESWCVGSTVQVRWNSRSVQEVKILLSNDGGATYSQVLAEHIPAPYGFWNWNIDPSLPAGTTYRIRVQDQNSSTVLDESGIFTINVPPQIVRHPDSVEVCVGDTAVFVVSAQGLPQPIAQWQVSTDGGQSWSNLNSSGDTLRVYPVQAGWNGFLYRALYQNVCEEGVPSRAALLTVLTQPQILEQSQDEVVCIGDTLVLYVVTDQQNVQYQWRKNGQVLPGYTGQQLRLPNVTPQDAGRYDVVITGRCPPPVVSREITIEVQDVPVLAEPPSFVPIHCPDEQRDTVIRLYNPGPLDIVVDLVGLDNSDYQFQTSFPISIPAQVTREIPVRFIPSKAGISVGTARFLMQPCNAEFTVTMGIRVDSLHLQTVPVDFGVVYQCDTQKVLSTLVRNTGTVPLQIDSLVFSSPSFSLVAPQLPIVIRPDSAYRFALQYSKTSQTGVITADAILYTNRCNYTEKIPLRVERDSLVMTVSQSAIVFDTLFECGNVAEERIYLYNPSTRALGVTKVESSNPAFAVVDPPVPFTILPRSTVWVTVQFTGGVGGWNTGTLTFRSNACDVAQTVEVSGFQVAPTLSFPAAVHFFQLSHCEVPKDTVLYLVNESSEVIRIDSVAVGPPFQILGVVQGRQIASGDSLEIPIRFQPPVPGSYQAKLQIFFTSFQCQGEQQAVLFARSIEPELAIHPSDVPLRFHVQECESRVQQQIALKNGSDIPVSVQALSFSTAEFQIVGPVPEEIPPNDSVFVLIQFSPSASGLFVDTLRINVQPCHIVLLVPVEGRKSGLSLTVLGIEEDTVDFGRFVHCPGEPFPQIEQRFRLTAAGSTGIDSIRIVDVFSVAPFEIQGVQPGNRYAIADTVDFLVRLLPIGPGTHQSEIVLVIDPCRQEIRIPVKVTIEELLLTAPPGTFMGITFVGVPLQKTLFWINRSSVPIRLKNVLSSNSNFGISMVKPAILPEWVAPGDSILLEITFQAAQEGKDSTEITLEFDQPCEISSTLRVRAEATLHPFVEIALSDSVVDFGAVPVGTIAQRVLTLTNTGNVPVRIDSIMFTGQNQSEFWVSAQTTFTIPASTSHSVQLNFQPLSVGTKEATMVIFASTNSWSIPVRGIGIVENATAILRLPDLVARPGAFVDIPITVFPDQYELLSVVDSFRITIAFRATVLYIHGGENVQIRSDTIIGKWRYVELQGAVQDTLLTILHGEVLLADTIMTPLLFSSVSWHPSLFGTVLLHGSLRLNTDFLVRFGKAFGIVAVFPQPVSDDALIFVQTPYRAEHVLSLYDVSGRRIWSYHFVPTFEQTQDVIPIVFPSSIQWQSGMYILQLETVERVDYYPLYILR